MTVWRYGDDINTDMLFPGKYTYSCATAPEIVPHLLEDLDAAFATEVRQGDVMLVGHNFGCGSSREQPVVGLKAVGVSAVIGRSFARIFYRAAINQGLVLVESPEAVDAWRDGDTISVDIVNGTLTVGEHRFTIPKLPPEIVAIQEAGGLLSHARASLEQSR